MVGLEVLGAASVLHSDLLARPSAQARRKAGSVIAAGAQGQSQAYSARLRVMHPSGGCTYGRRPVPSTAPPARSVDGHTRRSRGRPPRGAPILHPARYGPRLITIVSGLHLSGADDQGPRDAVVMPVGRAKNLCPTLLMETPTTVMANWVSPQCGEILLRERSSPMGETRGKFGADFREGAIRLVRKTGKPIAQMARELGIDEGTFGKRVNADRHRRKGGDGQLSDDERAELARLRKENAELAMECDVLKRSVALRVHHAMSSRSGVRQQPFPGRLAQQRLDDVKWHLIRYDNLRISLSSRGALVLSPPRWVWWWVWVGWGGGGGGGGWWGWWGGGGVGVGGWAVAGRPRRRWWRWGWWGGGSGWGGRVGAETSRSSISTDAEAVYGHQKRARVRPHQDQGSRAGAGLDALAAVMAAARRR